MVSYSIIFILNFVQICEILKNCKGGTNRDNSNVQHKICPSTLIKREPMSKLAEKLSQVETRTKQCQILWPEFGLVLQHSDLAQRWRTGTNVPFPAATVMFFSSPECPEWLWDPPSHPYKGYHALFLGGKVAWAWSWLLETHLMSRLKCMQL